MPNELTSDVFGQRIILRLGTPLVTGEKTASVIGIKGAAWSQVFTYDPIARVMNTDRDALANVIDSCPSATNVVLGFFIAISDIIVGGVDVIVQVINTVLGSFVGFGLIGVLFVLMLFAFSIMISIYALIIITPILVVSYSLRFWKNKKLKKEAEKLQRAALQLFEDPSSRTLISEV